MLVQGTPSSTGGRATVPAGGTAGATTTMGPMAREQSDPKDPNDKPPYSNKSIWPCKLLLFRLSKTKEIDI